MELSPSDNSLAAKAERQRNAVNYVTERKEKGDEEGQKKSLVERKGYRKF